MLSDIVSERGIEFIDAGNPGRIQGIEGAGTESPEIALCFSLAGAVPYRGMDQDTSQLAADKGKLDVFVRRAMYQAFLIKYGDTLFNPPVPVIVEQACETNPLFCSHQNK